MQPFASSVLLFKHYHDYFSSIPENVKKNTAKQQAVVSEEKKHTTLSYTDSATVREQIS